MARLLECQVNDRRGEESVHLRDDEAADHGDVERLAQLRADSHVDSERHRAPPGTTELPSRVRSCVRLNCNTS